MQICPSGHRKPLPSAVNLSIIKPIISPVIMRVLAQQSTFGMAGRKNKSLWIFSEAAAPTAAEKFLLLVLVIAGSISIIQLGDWWFRAIDIGDIFLYILLSLCFWFGMSRLILVWINNLQIHKPLPVPAPEGLRVAIFTTSSPGEPLSMFEKTLAACKNVRYPHTTYLLDDTRDPAFRKVAEEKDR